jgi:parallel beta-helix repeat protein
MIYATMPGWAINRTIDVRKGESLQTAIDISISGDTIKIGEGEFRARPSTFIEDQCGNCTEQNMSVTATRGFIIEGKSIVIIGENPFQTKLITNAGYGVMFNNSHGSSISNLTITGGKRDTCGNATDAGIVVKNSIVHIKNVHVKDNTDQASAVVVGIAGIIGREGSEIIIEKSIIRNNSWDGIALYRGTKALIIDNMIEQGRGVGIGVTWDANATILRNSVSYYWKGIGTFGNAVAIVKNNAIYENNSWGIAITGSSFMEAANNVVTRNGNCGVAIWDSTSSGKIYNNAITENGWRDEWLCPQVGFWMNGEMVNVEFSYNDVWNNVMGDYRQIEDQTGINGNISAEPLFLQDSNYKTLPTSPLRKAGNPNVRKLERDSNHIGIEGGPAAR